MDETAAKSTKEGKCILFLIKNCFHDVCFFFSRVQQDISNAALLTVYWKLTSLSLPTWKMPVLYCTTWTVLIPGSRRWNWEKWENWVTQDGWWDNGLNLSAADFSV